MRLQKTTGLFLASLLLLGGISAYTITGVTADAAITPTQLTKSKAELFLPTSYEQYLPLSHPSDVAVSERYIAIAEGTSLYLYDRAEKDAHYRVYEHGDTISKIQLTTDEKLYFADGNLGFYELSLTEDELCTTTEVGLTALSTFYIQGETLFSVNMTNTGTEYRTSNLSAPNRNEKFDSTEFRITPRMTYLNGRFYSFVNSIISIYEYNDAAEKYMRVDTQTLYPTETVTGLESVCTLGGKIYFTLNKDASGGGRLKNGLHVYDPENKTSALVMEANSLSALTVNGEELYCIQNGSLHKISLSDDTATFTGYEIAASSTSVNRYYHAVDVVRARDLLVTADAFSETEGRIGVYRFSTGEYSQIPCVDESGAAFSPKLVATDGETIAVASGRNIYASENGESFTLVHTMMSSVRGIACVYGSVYFITDNYVYGKVGSEAEAVRPYEGDVAAFTNDLYGNLYVAYGNAVQTTVYRFTEEEFINNDASGATVATYDETFTCLRADFENNLYYLANGALYKNGEQFAALDGNEFVFRGEDAQSLSPSVFALGFEDDEVYFAFDNFAIRSKAGKLDVPSLNKIPLQSAVSQALSPHAPENLFVEISQNAVGILIDLDGLADKIDYFPYLRYYRTNEAKSGVLLAQTKTYDLVMLFDRNRNYTANLFLKTDTVNNDADVYEETSATRYLSCNTAAYYVPCMHDALAGAPLTRGDRVAVMGVVSAIDGDYAYVEITGNSREAVRGYVPFTFLTEVNPLGDEPLKYSLGKLNDKGAEVTFTCGQETVTLERGTQVRLYLSADGDYRAEYEKDGKIYSAYLTEDMFERNETDALRISLIVILSVLAVVIIGVYVYMLPRKKTRTN